MLSHKIVIKFYIEGQPPALERFVPVFHSWIQAKAIPNHMLIDVADYKHVHNGPGIVLISHEANFSIDHADGRPGLMYQRKQPAGATFGDHLTCCFKSALDARKLLETAMGLRFSTEEVVVRIADRLAAPNTVQTFADIRPELERLAESAGLGEIRLAHQHDPRRMFEVCIHSSRSATD